MMAHLKTEAGGFDVLAPISLPTPFIVILLCVIHLIQLPFKIVSLLLDMLPPPKIMLRYKELELITVAALDIEHLPFGDGACTSVYKAHRDNQAVALKVWRVSCWHDPERATFYQRLEEELMVWKRLVHPNIGRFHALVEGFGNAPAMLSPFYRNGNINKYLKKNPSADALHLFEGVLSGLSFMHNQNPPLAHGDVRGSNILISDTGEPLLVDIGINNIPQPPDWTYSSGDAMRWMAPEILHVTDIADDIYPSSLKGDVYSFGMTLLEIYTGHAPFPNRRFYATAVFDVVNGIRPPRPTDCSKLTDGVWEIITSCWEHDPLKRPNIDGVQAWLRVVSRMSSMIV